MKAIKKHFLSQKRKVYSRLRYWTELNTKGMTRRKKKSLVKYYSEQELIINKILGLMSDLHKLEKKSTALSKDPKQNKKAVALLNEKGKVEMRFDSILSASKHLKISPFTLSKDIKNACKYGVRFIEHK
jgi:hypothetical protein